jgi:glutamine amidotransferase
LIFRSDSSLEHQSYSPRLMSGFNLAGSGFAAWDQQSLNPTVPFLYRDVQLPTYDENLRAITGKLRTDCAIAHIRGTGPDGSVNRPNCQPFYYPGAHVSLAHNGDLARFAEMKFDLVPHIKPQLYAMIRGTTDSEWIYALLLSQLGTSPPSRAELEAAVIKTLEILRSVRKQKGIDQASSVNLFISDGSQLVATRFVYDFGNYADVPTPHNLRYPELWYTAGTKYGCYDGQWRMSTEDKRADSILIASEPLTADTSSWVQVQEYSLLSVWHEDGALRLVVRDLDL